ncbi:hypothetical protein EDB81DRAFT_156267 [Dactylonectria macrodidyma]|uniref:WW domain-containing protein n=1 Tax=Dactylonectria macrodidyma TaxID=307937 RepID=A0A9P9JL71_9HYPO|nr:hypothetical protein EDB81DRAFT_156267 [Dactylonectria macrodidyma]
MPSSPNPSPAVDGPATQSPGPEVPVESPAMDASPETTEEQADTQDLEPGEVDAEPQPEASKASENAPGSEDAAPLPSGPVPDGPPLPNEPVPTPEDDGWDCQWDPSAQSWYFVNRFTGKSQWDNPRVQVEAAAVPSAVPLSSASLPPPPALEQPAAGGYNPAIHGDYDPNAWYAKGSADEGEASSSAALTEPSQAHGVTASFNRFTGQFQTDDMGPNRHSDEAKSRRQMNAFFDVDAAANAHDGRSLKAERSGKKPSKNELKAFKEKRRARKEEKRRAWLRD